MARGKRKRRVEEDELIRLDGEGETEGCALLMDGRITSPGNRDEAQ